MNQSLSRLSCKAQGFFTQLFLLFQKAALERGSTESSSIQKLIAEAVQVWAKIMSIVNSLEYILQLTTYGPQHVPSVSDHHSHLA